MHNRSEPTSSYWRMTRRITLSLLAVWAALIVTVALFARELSAWQVLGMPFPFYFFSQGALLFFLALVAGHTWLMNRVERRAKTADTHTEH